MTDATDATDATDPCHAHVDALLAAAYRGRHDDTRRALATARQALALAEQAGYVRGRAWALLRVALCECIVADPARHYEQRLGESIALMRDLGELAGEAEAMNLLAHILEARAERDQATALRRRCLELRRQTGDIIGQAGALLNLGHVLLDAGQADEALGCLRESLQLATEAQDHRGLAYAHAGLGRAWAELGDDAAALGQYELAFVYVTRTEDRALECTVLIALGRARAVAGQHGEAMSVLQHAHALALRTGNAGDLARVHHAQAAIEQARGDDAAAEACLHAALHVLLRAEDRALEAEVRLGLSQVLLRLRQPEAAHAQDAQAQALQQAAAGAGPADGSARM